MDVPSEISADEQAISSMERHGASWSTAEYAQLVEEIRSGLTLDEIAEAHRRSHGGITSACNRLLLPELQSSPSQNVLTALASYLQDHPDEHFEVRSKSASKSRKRRGKSKLPPLPETVGRNIEDQTLQLESGDALALVVEAITSLEGRPREYQILRMRLGLSDASYTLADIAEKYGLSRERIRQIQDKALAYLVRQARKPGTAGETLASLLHLPAPDRIDETFAERIAALAASEFEAPSPIAILFLLCAAGVASPTARQVALLAGAAEKRRYELETERRRTHAAEHHRADIVHRADATISRWIEHASWPTITTVPPMPEMLQALRLTGPAEAIGSFHSDKLDREVFYESSLELTAFTILENSTNIAWYQEQPFKIPYTYGGRERIYYPDLLAATRTGRCLLVEVKPLVNMPVALNRAKAVSGRAYAHARGWGWVTIEGSHTERDLEAHVIPARHLQAIIDKMEAGGHLSWRQILELRADFHVSSRDIAAFIIQTGAQLTLEPHYRITAAK